MDTCETCGEPDTIIHTLWECSCSAGMWQQLFAHISDKLDAGHLAFNAKGIVLNRVHPKYGHVVDLYCLVMKQLSYRCKCKREKLNFSLFLHEIKQIRQYELVLAKQQGKTQKHLDKWKVVGWAGGKTVQEEHEIE